MEECKVAEAALGSRCQRCREDLPGNNQEDLQPQMLGYTGGELSDRQE